MFTSTISTIASSSGRFLGWAAYAPAMIVFPSIILSIGLLSGVASLVTGIPFSTTCSMFAGALLIYLVSAVFLILGRR